MQKVYKIEEITGDNAKYYKLKQAFRVFGVPIFWYSVPAVTKSRNALNCNFMNFEEETRENAQSKRDGNLINYYFVKAEDMRLCKEHRNRIAKKVAKIANDANYRKIYGTHLKPIDKFVEDIIKYFNIEYKNSEWKAKR